MKRPMPYSVTEEENGEWRIVSLHGVTPILCNSSTEAQWWAAKLNEAFFAGYKDCVFDRSAMIDD